jgi:carbamoyltransferase
MLYVADVTEKAKNHAPAIVHIDDSSRIQSVRKKDNPLFWNLLNKFYEKTGVPLLLNTSLNVNGEPIASRAREVLKTFFSSGLDVLYMGDYRISK